MLTDANLYEELAPIIRKKFKARNSYVCISYHGSFVFSCSTCNIIHCVGPFSSDKERSKFISTIFFSLFFSVKDVCHM